MPKQTLKNNLKLLREQLDEPVGLDKETREQLSAVADEIENVLRETDPDFRQAHASVQDAALRFEARHPAFARILSDLTDALAKLGI